MNVERDGGEAASSREVFIAHIQAGTLVYPRSRSNGEVLEYSARPGGRVGDIDWVPASGHATLHSFAIYHRRYSPDFPTPYNVCQVRLREGPLLVSSVDAEDISRLYVGMPLIAAFTPTCRLVFRPDHEYRETRR